MKNPTPEDALQLTKIHWMSNALENVSIKAYVSAPPSQTATMIKTIVEAFEEAHKKIDQCFSEQNQGIFWRRHSRYSLISKEISCDHRLHVREWIVSSAFRYVVTDCGIRFMYAS